MSSVAINKVTFGGNTLIDISGDTVTASTLLSGYTAHDASGTQITGQAAGSLPTYTGATTVTPTESTQTLSTANTSVLANITVNPIPDNYGRITQVGNRLVIT